MYVYVCNFPKHLGKLIWWMGKSTHYLVDVSLGFSHFYFFSLGLGLSSFS